MTCSCSCSCIGCGRAIGPAFVRIDGGRLVGPVCVHCQEEPDNAQMARIVVRGYLVERILESARAADVGWDEVP